MNTNRIVLNETSYFGPGSRSVIPEEVKRRNLKKAFIVTDNDLVKFGVVKQVTDILEQAAIPYTTFAEVKQNPTVTNVKAFTLGLLSFNRPVCRTCRLPNQCKLVLILPRYS